MAGVYIPGMEMPETCLNCELLVDYDSCEGYECYCNFVGKLGYLCDLEDLKRSEKCPLVPVPPHGISIDADEFLNRAFGTGLFGEDDMRLLGELVGGSPTIIPADKEETE